MDQVVLETDVRVAPAEVFAFLMDFPGYVKYSEYLEEIRQDGDGGEGTTYELALRWWRLSYTARTEVTAVKEPERIEWEVKRVVRAHGAWEIDPVDPPEVDWEGSRVRLRIQYAPDTADASVIGLPPLVSVGWLVDRIQPIVLEEAERIVRRVVADLEGEPRPVELRIQTP